jgi:hypothetical protein
MGPVGPMGHQTAPRSPTQLLRVSSLATCDPSQGTYAAHLAHRKEPADTMATVEILGKGRHGPPGAHPTRSHGVL